MQADLVLEYDNSRTAKSIACAISPDNFKTPIGLLVKTRWKDKEVRTTITCKGKLATFIATIDDLLFCTSTAEKTLNTLKTDK